MGSINKTYDERNPKGMINISEAKAKEFYESKNVFVKKFGFDETDPIPTELFWKIPEIIRNMPDHIIITKSWCYLLEVK